MSGSTARVRVVAVICAVVLGASACASSGSRRAPAGQASRIAASTSAHSTAPTPTTPAPKASALTTHSPTTHSPTKSKAPTAAQVSAQVRAQVAAQVQKIIRSQPSGSVSVAALNMASGKQFSAGATSGMWTASSYKLLALIALVLQGGTVGECLDTARAAIVQSDNVAGYSLFTSAGGNSALNSALSRLGAKHTVPGNSDPTFTRTSASDYLRVLKALVTPSAIPAGQRSQIIGLMQQVQADQRWGVGVVADKGDSFANKNGWLSIDDDNEPGESDNGLWAVNSVGIVKVDGQQVLMAVFTQHQSDFETGVDLVQKLARTIVAAVAKSK